MGKLRWPLEGDIAAAALEKPVWGDQLSTDLIHRVVKFESKFVSGASLLHCWAARDRSGAFFMASQMGLEDVVGGTENKDKYGATPLDCALRTGSSGNCLSLLKCIAYNSERAPERAPERVPERLPERAPERAPVFPPTSIRSTAPMFH